MARKQKKYHYIYKITCDVTNRYYIGMHSTNDLNDGYMGSGKRLWNSLNHHGKDNHTKEILAFYDNRELLVEAEKESITLDMVGDKDCMNLTLGGNGSFEAINGNGLNNKVNQNQKGGDAIAKRLKNDPELRKRYAEMGAKNFKEAHAAGKIRYDTFKDKSHSEETKKKMSESKKGKYGGKDNPSYGSCWITKEGSNKKIKKENLDTYLEEGWVKGRKMK